MKRELRGLYTAFYRQLKEDIKNVWDNNRLDHFKKHMIKAIDKGFPIDFCPTNVTNTLLIEALLTSSFGHKDDGEICRLLLDVGADVNIRGTGYRTALIYAAAFIMPIDVIKKILERTEDVNAQDSWGFTALGRYCNRYVNMIQDNGEELPFISLLLKAGANPYLDAGWLSNTDDSVSPSVLQQNREELKKYLAMFKEQKETITCSSSDYEYEI